MLESGCLKHYLSSLKYPLVGEAIVPFALGVICILADLILLKFTSIVIDLLHWRLPTFRFASATTYIGLLFLFFLLAFLSNMVLTSAEGKDTLCDSPQFIDRFEDVVVQPGLRSSVVILTYIMPFLIALVLGSWQIGVILLLAGFFFLPMAYMRTCVLEDFEGMNPKACLQFFCRSPFAYTGLLLMSLAWLLGTLLPLFCFFFLVFLSIEPGLGAVVLFYILYALFIFYITAVYMNILGRFYRKHEETIEEE